MQSNGKQLHNDIYFNVQVLDSKYTLIMIRVSCEVIFGILIYACHELRVEKLVSFI